MPIIDSKKYSCESCIRGHRATTCTHANRLLVLVRKPGRPMQNCAHEFRGCVCGRLGGVGDWGVDRPRDMLKSTGCDVRGSFNVNGIMGSEMSRGNVSKTESKKKGRKVKKGGIGDAQKNKVKKRAKYPTTPSREEPHLYPRNSQCRISELC
ncbi:uncharacterized protein EAF01_011884 [Botrytis porri]|uniref:uncharacterized protein n=1 Tax=Botrytis porri TaxID=87229 RepID=UPI0019014FB1|nr:uncharacterized protein EAF01_011884 [Botrytis porri]KAF7881373.1 hypothetical protein EAF01_011884 [Botrytis porri]